LRGGNTELAGSGSHRKLAVKRQGRRKMREERSGSERGDKRSPAAGSLVETRRAGGEVGLNLSRTRDRRRQCTR
jgi:hypothetical protein